MDQAQISRDMLKGQKARDASEILEAAFTEIERDIFRVWQETKTEQSEQREEAWLTQRAMRLLRLKLEGWINNGKIATAELERQKKKNSR